MPTEATDPLNSHGFFKYSVKCKSGISVGSAIDNNASIVFDFNLPIVTNTVTTLISDTIPLQVPEMMSSIMHVAPFPNPSSDFIYIKNLAIEFNEIISAYTFNSLGVIVSTQTLLQNPPRIDVSSFASGVYYTRLLSKSGKSFGSFKFVKE
ncbi:MAG: T9SS type A sorting domain-containing protein [Bacteroidetes bacterium]|nr:T9SS type A sorting domain-containing protein [Bacteroidota bacterium]